MWYHWSGSEELFPAIALVQLENRIGYYERLPSRATLVTRARALASARLAGEAVTGAWQAAVGEGGTDACVLATTRGGITWSTYGSIGGSKPSAEDDVDACLALLHRAIGQPNGELLARSVLDLTQDVDEGRARRVKRCRLALASGRVAVEGSAMVPLE